MRKKNRSKETPSLRSSWIHLDHGNPVAKDSGGFFFFFFFIYIYTLNPKNMCTLYTVSNKTITDVRGSAEQLPQDLGGTTLNLPRLGPSGRIV